MAQNIRKARKVFQSQNLLGDDLLEDDNDLTACSLLFQILTNPSRFFEGGLRLFRQLSFYGANKRVPSVVVGLEMKNEFRTAMVDLQLYRGSYLHKLFGCLRTRSGMSSEENLQLFFLNTPTYVVNNPLRSEHSAMRT